MLNTISSRFMKSVQGQVGKLAIPQLRNETWCTPLAGCTRPSLLLVVISSTTCEIVVWCRSLFSDTPSVA